MKQVLLFLSIATFILFTSCEKDAEPEPEPISLAQNLQNGIWENSGDNIPSFYKFDGTNVKRYLAGGWSTVTHTRCISIKNVVPYTLVDSTLTIGTGNAVSIKIEGDILTMGTYILQRKETTGYPGC